LSAVLQAPLFDGFSFDPFSLFDDVENSTVAHRMLCGEYRK
tara:strand:- start:893 stop:1015 length:123 start_codon:yes stop_codon:yes gene_type:complete